MDSFTRQLYTHVFRHPHFRAYMPWLCFSCTFLWICLPEGLNKIKGLKVDVAAVETNIVSAVIINVLEYYVDFLIKSPLHTGFWLIAYLIC